jgi:hypothetical protein
MISRFQSVIFAFALFSAVGTLATATYASSPVQVVGQGENFAVTYPPDHEESPLPETERT